MNLTLKRNIPNTGKGALSPSQAAPLAAEVPKWSLSRRPARISREFKFKDFRAAMKFVNKVADCAEEEEHHPDFQIHWNRVELILWTHDIGGLSQKDFVVAAKIDQLS